MTSNAMPVNSKRALNELLLLLEKNQTNSFHGFEDFTEEDKLHVQSLMAFLNAQVFGQLYRLDSIDLFSQLAAKVKEQHSKKLANAVIELFGEEDE